MFLFKIFKALRTKGLLFPAALVLFTVGLSTYAFVFQESIPPTDLNTLHLSGRLVMAVGKDGVAQIDMSTGAIDTLFDPPGKGLVTAASVSPDGSQIVLAYAPPPDGFIQSGLTDLYIMPADGGSPPTLFLQAEDGELFFNPAWSPDGNFIYYSHAQPSSFLGLGSSNSLERIAFPDGEPELVLENAHSPTFRADGSRMAYVAPGAQGGADDLFVANVDGSQAVALLEGASFAAVDRPHFSPDGDALLFSAAVAFSGNSESSEAVARLPTWLSSSLGIRVASAHDDVVADIWYVPAIGGKPTRLTSVGGSRMVAAYAPDGNTIAFITTARLHLMNPDGTQLSLLLDRLSFRSIQWVA